MSRPVVLITGYRGLAETFIRAFLCADFQVSVLVHRESAINALRQSFPGICCDVGDVADGVTQQRWLHKTLDSFGRVDHLINNAAVLGPHGRLHEIEIEEFNKTLEINLEAPVRLTQLWLQYHESKKSHGVVINLSGGGAANPRPGFSPYALSKTALVRLTENLSQEYPQHRFYAISPGLLATNMTKGLMTGEAQDPNKAADLATFLLDTRPHHLNGKLIHAVWDDYRNAPEEDGWWTLRRIDEKCRKIVSKLD